MIQNLQDIQEKIFFESKNILETLGKITSQEELLNKQDLILELTERVAFLKVLNKNKDFLAQKSEIEPIDNQSISNNIDDSTASNQDRYLEGDILDEDQIEEEVIFTNEINESETYSEDSQKINADLEAEKNTDKNLTSSEQPKEEFFEIDNESKVSQEIVINEEEILPTYEERVAQKEKEFLEMEERRRKIVEISKHEPTETLAVEPVQAQEKPQSAIEKKFKLASIKGIKAVKNLFDEDPLEKVEEEETENRETESGSILKTNIATDFMEATKKRPEFRIDFNDKIAFTKLLFGGDEAELRKMVDQLNSYEHLEDARQFLSEVYYKKDWRNVDEYAQRLWTLVENKFL